MYSNERLKINDTSLLNALPDPVFQMNLTFEMVAQNIDKCRKFFSSDEYDTKIGQSIRK